MRRTGEPACRRRNAISPPEQASAMILVMMAVWASAGCRKGEDRQQSTGPARQVSTSGQRYRVPGPDRLPSVKGLPDPFLLTGGARIRRRDEWTRRRDEIKKVLLDYQYGHPPPRPDRVKVTEVSAEKVYGDRASKKMLRLTTGPDGRITWYVGLIVPEGKGPFPVILHVDHRMIFGVSLAEELIERGYMVVGYDPRHLDPDRPGTTGPAQAAYPDHDWATLTVWAWGAMRVVDVLVTLGTVDRARIAITGHSRSGKTALLAGALDERISLVVPQGSGCGGAASYRFRGQGSEGLAQITRNFGYWFQPQLAAFAGREDRLPFDQHFVLALVAPRALLSIDALGDLWANPLGTQQAYLGARPVFDLLGAKSKQGIYFRDGGHELTDEDWRTLADFADWVFFGKPPPEWRRFDHLPVPARDPPYSWSPPRREGG